MIYQKVIMKIGVVFVFGLTLVSCNKNEKKVNFSKKCWHRKTDTKLKIEDYFPGPNYMLYIVS